LLEPADRAESGLGDPADSGLGGLAGSGLAGSGLADNGLAGTDPEPGTETGP
jgi:hypothetical protein